MASITILGDRLGRPAHVRDLVLDGCHASSTTPKCCSSSFARYLRARRDPSDSVTSYVECIAVTGDQKIELFWHQLSQAKGLGFFCNLPSGRFEPGDVALPRLDGHDHFGPLLGLVRPADGVRQCLDSLACKRVAVVIELPQQPTPSAPLFSLHVFTIVTASSLRMLVLDVLLQLEHLTLRGSIHVVVVSSSVVAMVSLQPHANVPLPCRMILLRARLLLVPHEGVPSVEWCHITKKRLHKKTRQNQNTDLYSRNISLRCDVV